MVHRSRGHGIFWAVGFAVGLGLILILATASFVWLVRHGSSSSSEPSAPPAPTSGESPCGWCEDLEDRLAPLSSSSGSDAAAAAANTKQRTQNAHACTHLTAGDFSEGTYVIDAPDTCYVLDEDIVFNPAPGDDFRAVHAPYASDPAFVLDFPAALLVRAPGITVDLNGHELRQSRAHNAQQRFFALVELTTPFIAGQGPADFVNGTEPVPAAHFVLRNGRLGLSSHHGVHGNGAWSVLIEDVEIRDYDVGAIALNGVHDVLLRRVRAAGTSTTVPVLGTYSSARFMMPFVDAALGLAKAGQPFADAKQRLVQASNHLRSLMVQVLHDVKLAGVVDKTAHPEAYALFGNPSGLPDGSASYGFVLHAHGVAVNGFECNRADAKHDQMHHVLIEDCEVHDTLLEAIELPVLKEVASGKLQRGPAGDILRVSELVAGQQGAYAGSALSDTKVALQEVVREYGGGAGTAARFGTLAVHPTVVAWARGDAAALRLAVEAGAFVYMRNGDNMFHVQKGAFGIRIGGGHHIAIRRTVVSGVVNVGAPANMDPLPGETVESAYWTGGDDGGHPGADPQHGYGGADSVGITVAAASNVLIEDTTVRNVHSRAGWATGIYVFNDATATHIHDAAIINITAHPDPALKIPGPKQPRAVGVAVTTDAQEPVYTGTLNIDEVVAGRIGMACNTLLDNTGIDGCSLSETNFYSQ